MLSKTTFLGLLVSTTAVFGTSPASAQKHIYFDIHNVLCKRDIYEFVTPILNPCNLATLAYVATRAYTDPLWAETPTSYQKLRSDIDKLRSGGDNSGEAYYHVFQKYGQKRLAQMVRQIACAYTVMPGMQEFVANLHNKRHALYIASNIGSTFLQDLAGKHPTLFDCFDLDNSRTVDFVNGNPIKKPDTRFFKPIPKRDTNYFIDDKLENIVGAKKSERFVNTLWFNPKEPAISITELEEQLLRS